jgi:hypothetical protein
LFLLLFLGYSVSRINGVSASVVFKVVHHLILVIVRSEGKVLSLGIAFSVFASEIAGFGQKRSLDVL